MAKRVASLVLAMLMLFVGSVAVSADDGDIQPLLDYTSSATVNLVISNNTAYCASQLIGYSSTTKIKITMTLQKKSLLWWSEADSWSATYYGNTAAMSRDCSVDSGTYRIKTVFVVYCGDDSETITVTTSEKDYS